MKKWKSSGIEPSPIDVDVTNDSLLPLWLAIPPRTAADLAISSAAAIDQELEEAPAELVAAIEKLGEKFRLYRSVHRKMHIDQIEEILDKKGNDVRTGKTISYKYILKLENQRKIIFNIKLDKETLELIDNVFDTPTWATRKEFGCKNSICELKDDEYCPVAQTVQQLINAFKNILSTEGVSATAISEQRTCTKECAIQVAVGSITGIYMAACGCPVLGKLKPMVRFHLPFSSLEETEYRVFSMYLLAQFLRGRKNLSHDFQLKELNNLYQDILTINKLAAAKIQELEKSDAAINGLMILNAFAQMVSFDLEDNDFAHLEILFNSWFESIKPIASDTVE
jgi:hypothetical protein